MNVSGYCDFASYYDILTGNVDYSAIVAYYDRLIKKFGGKKGILLDLACGTGSASVLLSESGYDVIGVDLSPEMLTIAKSKPHENIEYLCQDMCELDMFGTIDTTVCLLDGINHLDSRESVKRAFSRVSLFTEKDGLFLFDVNTVKKHTHILADNAFVYDMEKLYCVWQNELCEENEDDGGVKVDIYLDFFEENEHGDYRRSCDYFSEIAYPLSDIRSMLEETGFEVLGCFDYLSDGEGDENCEKVTFAAKKK